MRRDVQPEILDRLAPDDPKAIRSRRDLRRVNAFMGNPGLIASALGRSRSARRHVVELGAGDGSVLLRVAKRLGPLHGRIRAVLVDAQPSVSADTLAVFRTLGWDVEVQPSDVFDWLLRPKAEIADVMLANLFLHHFRDPELATLLAGVSRQSRRFIACEPLRSRTALTGASLLIFIGCNAVTRHDAVVSVRAGFRSQELSALWPNEPGWQLHEHRGGLFSHMFEAEANTSG